jgi:hypothetical protein
MQWSVYVDLDRPLAGGERNAIFAAVDAVVPGSGCVGPDRDGTEEVYFVVDADDEDAARRISSALMARVLAASAVVVGHAITLRRR